SHDQRLLDQRAERAKGVGYAYRLDVFEREAAGEYAKAPEQRAFRLRQEVVAPVDRGLERLVARQRRATSAGEQGEAVAQPLEDLLHAEDSCSHSRQLDGEGQAVEAAAEIDDRGLVGGRKLERARRGLGALEEEGHGLVLAQLPQRLRGV